MICRPAYGLGTQTAPVSAGALCIFGDLAVIRDEAVSFCHPGRPGLPTIGLFRSRADNRRGAVSTRIQCPYMDSPSFASKLYLADMARLHTYIRPLKLAYVYRCRAIMVYSRASSQSLCRTSRTWTFPGLTDAGLTSKRPFKILAKRFRDYRKRPGAGTQAKPLT